MLKLLRYLDKRQRGQALLTLVFVVLQVWLDLTLPDYMATITSLAETPGSTMGQILVQGGYMMLCAAGSLVCNVICVYLASRVAAASRAPFARRSSTRRSTSRAGTSTASARRRSSTAARTT